MALQDAMFVMMLANMSCFHPDEVIHSSDPTACAMSCFSSIWCHAVSYSELKQICKKSNIRYNVQSSRFSPEFGWNYYQLRMGNCPIDYVFTRYPVVICFKVFNEVEMVPEKAKESCRNNGGSLITLDSSEKIDYMKGYLTDIKVHGKYFIGCEGNYSGGVWTWKWPDGSGLTDMDWSASEPDNIKNEIYVVLNKNNQLFKWENIGNHPYHFICENQI